MDKSLIGKKAGDVVGCFDCGDTFFLTKENEDYYCASGLCTKCYGIAMKELGEGTSTISVTPITTQGSTQGSTRSSRPEKWTTILERAIELKGKFLPLRQAGVLDVTGDYIQLTADLFKQLFGTRVNSGIDRRPTRTNIELSTTYSGVKFIALFNWPEDMKLEDIEL